MNNEGRSKAENKLLEKSCNSVNDKLSGNLVEDVGKCKTMVTERTAEKCINILSKMTNDNFKQKEKDVCGNAFLKNCLKKRELTLNKPIRIGVTI